MCGKVQLRESTVSSTKNYPAQLPLALPVDDSHGREDIVIGKANALAIEMIDRWPDWSSSLMILAGPAGAGKSHLASIWAEKAGAWICDAGRLGEKIDTKPDLDNFLIEDIGRNEIDETALFHLINQTRARGGYGLLTSALWPQSWNIRLPDLMSRLRAASLVELGEPDDIALRHTMIKLFSDRQIIVERTVIDYLLMRMERSHVVARQIVEALDQEALASGKPITRPMAARVLERMAG